MAYFMFWLAYFDVVCDSYFCIKVKIRNEGNRTTSIRDHVAIVEPWLLIYLYVVFFVQRLESRSVLWSGELIKLPFPLEVSGSLHHLPRDG